MGETYIKHGSDEKCRQNFGRNKMKGRGCLGRPRHRWEANIKIDLKKYGVSVWTGFCWFWIAVSCKHGNKPWGYMKGWYFSTS
jgi:hypothetical protein